MTSEDISVENATHCG